MKREEVVSIVNDFLIEDLEIDETKIAEEASIKNDLKIDSLDFVDIVVLVEHNFGIKIKAEEMANVKVLSQFYDYIQARTEQK